ncbi:MAG: undecaprenyl-phosphate glucose phosphotransferase [Acidobacteriota bacterium]|nr:undecaprenyl-phosphate glucose phosphotransferase [Acidobacteriota bacterium]
MINRRTRSTAALYLVSDGVTTVAAFFLAWTLRFQTELVPWVEEQTPNFQTYLRMLPFVAFAWPAVFYFQGLYQPRRNKSRVEDAIAILFAVIVATLILTFFTSWYRPAPGFTFSRGFLGAFAVSSYLLSTFGRLTLREMLRAVRRRGHNLLRILVIGSGRLGREVTQKIMDHRELGFEVIGFLDDKQRGDMVLGRPVFGGLADLPATLEAHPVDQIMIALPLEAHRKTLRILEQVSKECVEVRLVPDVLQYTALTAAVEDLDGTPLINLSSTPLEGWSRLFKRTMDVALSSVLMMGLGLVLPFIALAIWWEDKGPIFYRQERMGLDGKAFKMIKFRSMSMNAESSTGPIWAVREDPRRTRVGSFLRRTSLDELPQLWNVFRGEMSLVGPRPERPAFVQEFKHKVPQYMQRHRVKAGITGWAQVHGWRGNTSIRKRIQYDIYYIENWSLKLDVKILWMTLRHGIRLNAY